LALAAHDVPFPAHRSDGRLGDVAVASSGFRDEYYGLVPHVHDLPLPRRPQLARTGDGPADHRVGPRPLVTSGLIDPGRCRWGERTVRFAKQTFDRPVVAVDELLVAADAAPGSPVARAAAWVAATSGPKVVVATQTRVGEAAVDETGSWVPSTPTIAVRGIDDTAGSVPGDTEIDRLWALAAVICSPLGTVAALADTF